MMMPDTPHSRTLPAFQGYAILSQWALSNDGMIVKVTLRSHSDVHPFRRYKVGSSGQRMHIAMSRRNSDEVLTDLGAWEAMLAWWSDDPKNGMKIHLRLDDGPDGAVQHPLEGMQKGDELYIACWLVDDSEEVVPPSGARKKRSWETMAYAQQAHTMCRDADFRKWSIEEAVRLGLQGLSEEQAAIAVIRKRCRIVSRSEFSRDDEHGLEARRQWTALVAEFKAWQGRP